MKRLLSAAFVATLMAAAACNGGGEQIATPRPTAYPRLSVAPALYHPLDAGGVALEVNDATTDSVYQREASTWVNIVYPTYCNGSTIYLTITPATAATVDGIIDNRLERIALNLGDSEAEVTELETPTGWQCRLVRALSPTMTPLQFIATGHDRVVSGAYYISAAGDSVAPLVNAVERDILHLLTQLSPHNSLRSHVRGY
ncbi:MAG: hypothetical protein J1E63_08050 [Muribaculaceae bacterium]|nr:hypothetical protein [Muribaculaceae bacterium]